MTHDNMRRALVTALLVAPLAPAFAQGAAAGWPAKPITIVTPFPPGSGPDVVARANADRLARNIGQRVVVENKPGASGFIAIDYVMRAGADGYTFIQLDSEHLSAVPALYPKRNFKPFDVLVPVATYFRTPFMVAVPSDSPWKTIPDLVAAAKAAPGKLSYGSWGVGSPGHLGGELFSQLTGTQFSHVPFKVLGELYQAVGNADVHWGFGSIASSQAVFKAGKLRYIAVAAPKRVAAMPDVPTAAEAGGPAALDVNSFVTLLAPKGVPKDITDRMGAEMTKANGDVELKARYDAFAFEPISWGVDEILRAVGAKAATYGELIRRANITLE